MKEHISSGFNFSQMEVDPFDPMGTKVALLRRITEFPGNTRIGFNLTGGTKLMYSGAIAACRKVNGVPFYLETRDHKLIFLDDFRVMDLHGVESLDTFLMVNGFDVSCVGKWEEAPVFEARRKLTKTLWNYRAQMGRIYNQLSHFTDFRGDRFIPF